MTADDVLKIATPLAVVIAAIVQRYDVIKAKRAHEASTRKLNEVSVKQEEIHKLVNKPLAVALDALATAKEQIARNTREDTDILEAVNARKRSNEHNAIQRAADDAKKVEDANREKIIADFLAGGGKS